MNLIDTNTVNDIFDQNIVLEELYYLAPDVLEEATVTAEIRSQPLSPELLSVDDCDVFDFGIYLGHYKTMLNKHSGKSFFNMTGFGDISILAATRTILDIFKVQSEEQLFDPTEQITVITRDKGLTKRLTSEFAHDDVVVRKSI